MNTIERSLKHFWHPCSQMKDYEKFTPLHITKAQGSYLYCQDGHRLIDAISSWWCKTLGHSHPRIKQAIIQQLDDFEHVIMANTTNNVIATLSEKLAEICAPLDKVMYASDGSCVVEMALKMSVHAHHIQGQPRDKFIALENGYHGETALALGVSDVGLYRAPYDKLLPKPHIIKGIPYVSGENDPLWNDCGSVWPMIEAQLDDYTDAAAVIFEPLIQGAGGMLIYSKDFLQRLTCWAKSHGVHVIADEIMTGLGRTGYPLACQLANIQPDFVCLAKGLTAGALPLSAMLTSTEIYSLFYDDYETGKAFMHSHTHTANTLMASVAVEVLSILETETIYQSIRENQTQLLENMQAVAEDTQKLTNIRQLGWLVAADLITDRKRGGYAVYQEAVKQGALLRPLGNTIYWMPPFNCGVDILDELRDITAHAIGATDL